MKKLLWVGDAGCDSGFAKATHKTLDVLRHEWDVSVLGLNYLGDPHSYPYPMYPAWRPWAPGDMFGISRIAELVRKIRPEVVVFQNDPWNIPVYMQALDEVKDVSRPTLIGAIAIDGKNCRGRALNGLDHCIFWTKFAEYEAIRGGYTKGSSIVPLGVDLEVYKPGDRKEARRLLGLPEQVVNGFVVGNVNRNQPRKRLDLTVQAFAEWVTSRAVPDAYLFLHISPTGDVGYNVEEFAWHYNIGQRICLVDQLVFAGVSEKQLVATYQAFDVQVNSGVGEGWGLTTMEGMACGIPQVVGDWAALAEWASDAALMLPCQEICAQRISVVGGLPDKAAMIEAFDLLYRDAQARENYRALGLALVNSPEYRWENIARTFADEVRKVAELAYA